MSGWMDEWMGGDWQIPATVSSAHLSNNPLIQESFVQMNYTKRQNLNRGYMKLDVWQRGMDLFEMTYRLAGEVTDFKLRSQFIDAAQSVSANIAEGYGRRSLPEYLQFLYIAKGSLAETLTRGSGFRRIKLIGPADFETFDQLHYEVANKLLALIASIESKRSKGDWQDSLPILHESTNPLIH